MRKNFQLREKWQRRFRFVFCYCVCVCLSVNALMMVFVRKNFLLYLVGRAGAGVMGGSLDGSAHSGLSTIYSRQAYDGG